MSESTPQEKPDKKSRKRKKHLFSQIRQQVEFYFSDSNMSKDRFLKKKAAENKDGYVDISILTTFNKLKQISEDVEDIAKALSKSELLMVSEDGLRVKRKIPVPENRNVDDRTVYVECLPATATHDWLHNVFSSCGKVAYVSLPRYHTSRDIKGFAFIEFEDPSAATRACIELNNPPAAAPIQPGWFPKGSKQMLHLEKQLADHGMSPHGHFEHMPDHMGGMMHQVDPNPLKRPIHDSEENVPPKKMCSDKDNSSSGDITSGGPSQDQTATTDDKEEKEVLKSPLKKRKAPDAGGEEGSESKKVRISDKVEVNVPTETERKRRNRKRTKKDKDEKVSSEVPELRVIPKLEWLSLKKDYLKLQKSSMQQLKQTLRQYRNPESNGGKDQGQTEAAKKDTTPQFTPGVIVKVSSEKSLTRKEVKDSISSIAETVYVDVLEGDDHGYIRCKDTDNANKLVSSSLTSHKMTLVEGDEEKQYWDKILSDREKKLNTKSKGSKKKRGREKVAGQADKINADINTKKHTFFID